MSAGSGPDLRARSTRLALTSERERVSVETRVVVCRLVGDEFAVLHVSMSLCRVSKAGGGELADLAPPRDLPAHGAPKVVAGTDCDAGGVGFPLCSASTGRRRRDEVEERVAVEARHRVVRSGPEPRHRPTAHMHSSGATSDASGNRLARSLSLSRPDRHACSAGHAYRQLQLDPSIAPSLCPSASGLRPLPPP